MNPEICQLIAERDQLRAKLAEWERWTKGHVWIRSEEYAELCALKRAHGPAPLPETVNR